MPAFKKFKFKSRTRTQSPVSQLPTTGTSRSSVAAIIEGSENISNTTDQAIPQSEGKTIIPTPSDTAEPARSAAVNALKFTLQQLSEAPLVPGIKLVAGAILDVINRCQNMAVVGKEWKKLTMRMASLRYLVGNIGKIDGREGLEERLLGELRDLARDLESASKQNKLEAFFNSDDDVSSLDSHNESLNFIIADLTVALANATHQNVDKIRKDIDTAVKQLHASVNNSPGGQVTHMTGNEIETVAGRYDSGNEVYGKNVKMVREIHNNKIGFIGGDAFSGNKVSEFSP
jgi:hypothetical protein